MPHVIVDRDFWDWAFDIFGAIGGLAGVIAIWFAIRAQRDAAQTRLDAAYERRRQFELEILQGIVQDFDENGRLSQVADQPAVLSRYQHRLDLLPTNTLPFWRTISTMRSMDDLTRLTGYKEPLAAVNAAIAESSGVIPSDPDKRGGWQANHNRLNSSRGEVLAKYRSEVATQLRSELDKAVVDRVRAGVPSRSRRSWWRRLRQRVIDRRIDQVRHVHPSLGE